MPEKTKNRFIFLVNLFYAAAIALLVVAVFKYVVKLVLPFIIAFIMVSVLNPLVRMITKKLPRRKKLVSVLIMILLYVVIGTILFFIVMALLVGIERFIQYFSPDYYSDVLKPTIISVLNNIASYIKELPPEWTTTFASIQSSFLESAKNLIGTISQKLISMLTAITGGVPGFVIAFVFTVMLSFFISVQYEEIIKFFKQQMPEKALTVVSDLKQLFSKSVGQYLGAILILMLITAVELSIGLTILGVNNSILIAIGIAVFDALPVFGTGAIVIPWIIIELIRGNLEMAFGLIVIYAIVTFVRNIIEPKIVGDRLGINPIVSIVSIYFGFKVFGVFGMIFMPIIIQIILELDKRGTIHLFKWDDKSNNNDSDNENGITEDTNNKITTEQK